MSSEDTRDSAASSVDPNKEYVLPDWIRKRKYSETYEEADKQLWEDLRKEDEKTGGSFLEQAFIKYIFIDVESRQAYVKMPTFFHEKLVKALRSKINSQSTEARPVLADKSDGIDLANDSRKYPDISIHAQDRTEFDEDGTLQQREYEFEPMNPNAIIEVSWSNKLGDELEKFAVQINECDDSGELGAINVGYLIKPIPRTRGQYPTKIDRTGNPLVGINVYRMERAQNGETTPTPLPEQPFIQWRHGEPYPGDLVITGEHLGQGPQGGVSIPFGRIVGALIAVGVRFVRPGEA